MRVKDFIIEREGNVVAWVIMGNMPIEQVALSVLAIQDAVVKAKQEHDSIRIIVDNYELSQEGMATVYTKDVMDKWGELQQWFVAHLNENDRIGVIQGGATITMQMTRLGLSIGLDKIERHLFINNYEETKLAVYDYLGIRSNHLIENKLRLARL